MCVNVWLEALKESGTTDEEFVNMLCHKSLENCPITLIQHVRGVTQLAIKIAEQFIQDFSQYITLDMDMVIVAAGLHDVGKVYEHMRDDKGELTWAAKNLHHPITGAAIAMKMGCPDEIVYAIANHSYEGDQAKSNPLLYVLRCADMQYYKYLFFGFKKKEKPGW